MTGEPSPREAVKTYQLGGTRLMCALSCGKISAGKADLHHDLQARLTRAQAKPKADREMVALPLGNHDDMRGMLPPCNSKLRGWWQW